MVLLEEWEKETRNRIPVIVVSGSPQQVSLAARASCAAIIRKPGPTDGERTLFSDHLQYVIRTVVSQKPGAGRLWDRIRQEVDRILPGNGHPLHWHPNPLISVPVSSVIGRVAGWVFILVCNALALYALAKSKGWPVKPVMWLFNILQLATVSLWVLIRRKRSH